MSPAFAEAVVEDLTVAVAQHSETLVISTGSTAGFGDAKVDASRAQKALGATHVLTGSVLRDGESVLMLKIRPPLVFQREHAELPVERLDELLAAVG